MNTTLKVHTLTHLMSREAGGLYVSVRRLAQRIADQGVQVDVTGLWDTHFDTDAASWLPLQPIAFKPRGPASLGLSPALHRHLNDLADDGSVIHLQGLWKLTSYATLCASRSASAPTIISPRGMLDTWALAQSATQKRLAGMLYENRNLRNAACIHALCDAELHQIRTFGLQNPVAVVPNGVDIPDLDTTEVDTPVPEIWRDRKRCLFMSRLHAKKGLLPLVDAIAQCKAELDDWVFIIAGPDNGGHRAEVEARIHERQVDDLVHFIGPVYGDAKDAWLRNVDAYILPSYSEGLPMAVLEAFAYALPAIITPECNLPPDETHDTAIMVNPAPDSIAEGLMRLTRMEQSERKALGQRGRALVIGRYTWENIAREMIAVYHWMINAGPRPDCLVDA